MNGGHNCPDVMGTVEVGEDEVLTRSRTRFHKLASDKHEHYYVGGPTCCVGDGVDSAIAHEQNSPSLLDPEFGSLMHKGPHRDKQKRTNKQQNFLIYISMYFLKRNYS